MSITLINDAAELELDPDLLWSDEYLWSAVAQSVDLSLTGALIVQSAARPAGRPITLESPDDASGWMRRSDVAQLHAWEAVPDLVLSLELRGVARDVMFRREDGSPAIEARPVQHFRAADPDDWYLVVIKFLEV